MKFFKESAKTSLEALMDRPDCKMVMIPGHHRVWQVHMCTVDTTSGMRTLGAILGRTAGTAEQARREASPVPPLGQGDLAGQGIQHR